MPSAPSTPVACASSTYRNASCAAARRAQRRQVRAVAIHGKHAFGHDEAPARPPACAASSCCQMRHVVVAEQYWRATPPARAPCTRLVWFSSSANSNVSGPVNAQQGAKHGGVGLPAARQQHRRLLALQRRELASTAACAASVPHTRRDAPAPVPNRAHTPPPAPPAPDAATGRDNRWRKNSAACARSRRAARPRGRNGAMVRRRPSLPGAPARSANRSSKRDIVDMRRERRAAVKARFGRPGARWTSGRRAQHARLPARTRCIGTEAGIQVNGMHTAGERLAFPDAADLPARRSL